MVKKQPKSKNESKEQRKAGYGNPKLEGPNRPAT